jgi:hypothetical protein
MLELDVMTDEGTVTLRFEHSLRSLSKWESKHKKAFLHGDKRPTEMLDYYQCMLLSPDIDPDLIYGLDPKQLDRLSDYINENQTASHVPQEETTSQFNPEITTSELIYFWLTALKINWEVQDWHLSRCMMLIQITSYKQQPPKKRNPKQVMSDWRQENERRKKLFNTSG